MCRRPWAWTRFAQLGWPVVGLGDLNGDDLEDFTFGAYGSDADGEDSGLVDVHLGARSADFNCDQSRTIQDILD